MVTKKKPTGRAVSMPVGIGIGNGLSLTITMAGAGIMAGLVLGEVMDAGMIGYGSMGILLLASWLGAMVAYGKIKHRRMMVCLVSGVTFLVELLAVTALFFGGEYSGVGITAVMVMLGAAIAGLMGMTGQGSVGWKHRKIRHR